MDRILRIDASPERNSSWARSMGDYLIKGLEVRSPRLSISNRDLSQILMPHIDETTIAGFRRSPVTMSPRERQATSLSDLLISELQSAEVLLITASLYNFGTPSSLKAWFDQIVRVSRTFDTREGVHMGLAKPKLAFVCISYDEAMVGCLRQGTPPDFMRGHIQYLLDFIGVPHVFVIGEPAPNKASESFEGDGSKARDQIDTLLDRFFGIVTASSLTSLADQK